MPRVRETWPDAVKIFACIMVVLGHFTQSMVKSGFMPTDDLYGWFQMTVYTFHVPLFFICSGYLYQRFSHVDSLSSWGLNVKKKALALGVPYLFFTCVTLAIKALAGDMANTAESGPLQTLLLHPTAPSWYLYALFFMFLVVPTVKTAKGAFAVLGCSLALKFANLIGGGCVQMPYAVDVLCINLVWFAAGMGVAFFGFAERLSTRTALVGALFLPLSIVVYFFDLGPWLCFCVGILACLCFVSLGVAGSKVWARMPAFEKCAQWTMPVFLMHTIFAAGLRVALLKIGVTSALVHIPLGLAIGFIGPVLAMIVMERLKPLDFLVYPNRYIKLKRSSR